MKAKRELVLAVSVLLMALFFTGCKSNGNSIDDRSKTAMIEMPSREIVQGVVERSACFSNGVVKIKINGITYETHIENVVVMETDEWTN